MSWYGIAFVALPSCLAQFGPLVTRSTLGLSGADSVTRNILATVDWSNSFALLIGLIDFSFGYIAGDRFPARLQLGVFRQNHGAGPADRLTLSIRSRIMEGWDNRSCQVFREQGRIGPIVQVPSHWMVPYMVDNENTTLSIDRERVLEAVGLSIARFARYLFYSGLLLLMQLVLTLIWGPNGPLPLSKYLLCIAIMFRFLLCTMQVASIMTYSNFYKGISTWAVSTAKRRRYSEVPLTTSQKKDLHTIVSRRLGWRPERVLYRTVVCLWRQFPGRPNLFDSFTIPHFETEQTVELHISTSQGTLASRAFLTIPSAIVHRADDPIQGFGYYPTFSGLLIFFGVFLLGVPLLLGSITSNILKYSLAILQIFWGANLLCSTSAGSINTRL